MKQVKIRQTLRITGIVWAVALIAVSGCRNPPSLLRKAESGQGNTQVIEAGGPEGDTGWWPQIIFDAKDRAHIAFCDAHWGNLRYGVETQDGWALETVAEHGKTGKYISLASRPDGGIGITYYDQSTHYFDYATRTKPSEPWRTEHVAWGLEAGMASALRYSADGHAHIVYYISSSKLIHASRGPEPGGAWLKQELGDYQAVYSARIGALAGPDGLWFSYVNWQMDQATLYLGHLGPEGWQQEVVPTARGAGWRSQLAQVGEDLWVVHSDALTENTALHFRGSDLIWHDTTLVRGGSSFAIGAYKGAGVMAFAQRNKRQRALYLTYQHEGTPWPVAQIATGVGNDPDVSLAIDSHGRVMVVYYDVSIRGLKSYVTHLDTDAL